MVFMNSDVSSEKQSLFNVVFSRLYCSLNLFVIFASMFVLLSCSCSHKNITHGNISAISDKIDHFAIGKTTKSEVIQELGLPTVGEYRNGESVFFYIQQKFRKQSMSFPKVIEQNVLEIIFDNNEHIIKITRYNLNNAKHYKYFKEKIEVRGGKIKIGKYLIESLGNPSLGKKHHTTTSRCFIKDYKRVL